nr:probable pectate lyase 5 [Ipomoea batatas]
MANLHSTLLFSSALLLPLFLLLVSSTPDHHQNPDAIVQDVNRKINNASLARRGLGYLSCSTGNPIDDCWRCDPNWEKNRQRLADCAIGFGKDALGGKNGRVYVVTDSGDDDPVNPKPGTLRHAVIQDEPLWITFQRDMVIQLKQELVMNSYKTIDGRGASVHISGGPCITIHYATNIIIHGIHGSIFGWTIARSPIAMTGLWMRFMVPPLSPFLTTTSLIMTKVMLLGHSDAYTLDKNMQVTVAFNHFGEGLVQRMPRCRHGYFHVVNNDYTHWELYAIGGSASPTINSQGNRFLASDDRFRKEVTKHEDAAESEWKSWNWRSEGDLMLNGAYFRQSGAGASGSTYARASSLSARPSSLVGSITTAAGALNCKKGSHC